MKKFKFPLERLRGLRQARLDAAQARMMELMTALAALEQNRKALEDEEMQAMKQIRQVKVIGVEQLTALDGFRRYAGRERLRLAAESGSLAARIERQREDLLAARRDVEALNHLREKRLNDWRVEVDREMESAVSELVIARWRGGGEPA
jgi:flagellar export protein FliJ